MKNIGNMTADEAVLNQTQIPDESVPWSTSLVLYPFVFLNQSKLSLARQMAMVNFTRVVSIGVSQSV